MKILSATHGEDNLHAAQQAWREVEAEPTILHGERLGLSLETNLSIRVLKAVPMNEFQ